MKILRMRAGLAALAVAAAGAALAEIQIIELAIETTAGAVVLPSSPPSSVVVTPCPGCTPITVPTSVRSQYFIDREPVTLDELKRRLAGRPNAFVLIIYDKKTGELRRLRASP
ncbi:MAG: hypothetical protein ACT4O5_14465 [Gammaproteobacteria bacterium]